AVLRGVVVAPPPPQAPRTKAIGATAAISRPPITSASRYRGQTRRELSANRSQTPAIPLRDRLVACVESRALKCRTAPPHGHERYARRSRCDGWRPDTSRRGRLAEL